MPSNISYAPVLRASLSEADRLALDVASPGTITSDDLGADHGDGRRGVVLDISLEGDGPPLQSLERRLLERTTPLRPLFAASHERGINWELDIGVMLPVDRPMHTLAFSWRFGGELALLRVSLTTTTYLCSVDDGESKPDDA